ncbi:MAG: PLP-dependent lyase/thiolase [Planctomycetes bacterium]|nr:PLP-dependent lyase/thiolase [Planctomycetota bacterium]
MELENPTFSHYDRVYFHLLRSLEAQGTIEPGRSRLIEVSSGSAGISFAWFCRQLGFDSTVVLPADLPAARINAVRQHGSKVLLDRGSYVAGAVELLDETLRADRESDPEERLFCVNHSRTPLSLEAMRSIADEAVRDAPDHQFDQFVGACGNGTSLLGIGSRLREVCGATVVSCDPSEAPVSYSLLHRGRSVSAPVWQRQHEKGPPRQPEKGPPPGRRVGRGRLGRALPVPRVAALLGGRLGCNDGGCRRADNRALVSARPGGSASRQLVRAGARGRAPAVRDGPGSAGADPLLQLDRPLLIAPGRSRAQATVRTSDAAAG